MQTSNRIQVTSAFEPLYQRAADIAQWPTFLPHYRWVKILERQENEITAEMAARHLGVPLWWRTVQHLKPQQNRIEFTHIGGITKGMTVQWIFKPLQDRNHWDVQIHHQFSPSWPSPFGSWFAHHIVGKTFVHAVAAKTLATLKRELEKIA